jgi:hypothetical protein
VTTLVFGLLAAIVLVALAGAVSAAVVPPRLLRRSVAVSTLAFLALVAVLAATWTQLPHND